jgi:hypothetical protein
VREQPQSRFYFGLDKAYRIKILISDSLSGHDCKARWAQPHPNPLNPPEKQSTPESKDGAHHETDVGPGEVADLRDLISRLFRGLPQILGLGLLGAAAAAVIALVFSPVLPVGDVGPGHVLIQRLRARAVSRQVEVPAG